MFIKAVVKSIKAILWGELAMLPRPRKVRQIGNAIKAEKGQVDRAALAFLKKTIKAARIKAISRNS